MARVLEVTMLELRPDADEQAFIKFYNEQYSPFGAILGMRGTLYKCDRGDRVGKFMVIWEFSSVELRDRFILPEHKISEEALQLLGPKFGELNKILFSWVAEGENRWPMPHYVEQLR